MDEKCRGGRVRKVRTTRLVGQTNAMPGPATYSYNLANLTDCPISTQRRAMCELNKNLVEERIRNGEYTVSPVPPNSKVYKSEVWKIFALIYDEKERKIDFAFCRQCEKVLQYSSTTGTKGLHKHPCTIAVFSSLSNSALSRISSDDRKKQRAKLKLDKDLVEERIRKGEYTASPVPAGSKVYKSEVWKTFSLIYDEKEQKIDFAFCRKCEKVLRCSSAIGTKGLLKHQCMQKDRVTSSSSSFTVCFSSSRNPPETKGKFTEACARFVAEDLRPYNIVVGQGFQQLIQAAIDIGASRGKIAASTIIPHWKTVRSRTQQMVQDIRNRLTDYLKEEGATEDCTLTTNVWTDDYRKLSYLTITIHYIDLKWTLNERVLCTTAIKEKQTAENIHSELCKIVEKFGITKIRGIPVVTNCAFNTTDAFEEEHRLNCVTHILNNVLSTTFEDKNLLANGLANVSELLKNCRDMIAYAKRAAITEQFDPTLQQVSESKWNTHLQMLISLEKNEKRINELQATGKYQIPDIDFDMVRPLIRFLNPFKDASDILEASKKPTLHHVMPCYRLLQDYLLVSDLNDSVFICKLKAIAKNRFGTEFSVHTFYCVATFLNPKMRTMKSLNELQREQAVQVVREMLDIYRATEVRNPDDVLLQSLQESSITVDVLDHGYAAPEKRPKTDFSIELWEDDDSAPEDGTVDEIEKYQSLQVPTEKDFNLLLWWKGNSTKLPLLSRIAKKFFSIPASSTPSGRNISVAGLVVDKLRTNLNPKNVDDLLFLRSNLDLIPQ